MVRLEDITEMVDNDLDDFYKDRDRFKGLKMLLGFGASEYSHEESNIQINNPKYKKKLKASKFIKKGGNKDKSLF